MVPKFAENGQGRLIWSWDHWKQRVGGVKMVMAQWNKRKSRTAESESEHEDVEEESEEDDGAEGEE